MRAAALSALHRFRGRSLGVHASHSVENGVVGCQTLDLTLKFVDVNNSSGLFWQHLFDSVYGCVKQVALDLEDRRCPAG